MSSKSAYTTTDSDTGRTKLHVDDIGNFTDLGLDLPFGFDECIYDSKRGIVHRPKGIIPSESGGFRLYTHTYSASKMPNGDLCIRSNDRSNPSGVVPMKFLLAIIDEESSEIVDTDRLRA